VFLFFIQKKKRRIKKESKSPFVTVRACEKLEKKKKNRKKKKKPFG
jgi:hypothetical protein